MAEGLARFLPKASAPASPEKNNFGVSPNEAGPLWLGLRLISPRTEQAYQGVTCSKGAYVLLMLRSGRLDWFFDEWSMAPRCPAIISKIPAKLPGLGAARRQKSEPPVGVPAARAWGSEGNSLKFNF
jgi:hypothetical protein